MKTCGDSTWNAHFGYLALLDVFGIVDTEPRTPVFGVVDKVDDIAIVLFIMAGGPYLRCVDCLTA